MRLVQRCRIFRSGPGLISWLTTWTGSAQTSLKQCSEIPLRKTEFSIGHRGAALQLPEHTKESYEAAARMGAGIVECDVTFTKDKQLVCRHSQCDLHTTTNILATPLAKKCSKGFTPAGLIRTGRYRGQPRPSVAPATSRWPSSKRCRARWMPLIRKQLQLKSLWAVCRHGELTYMHPKARF